MDCDEDVGRFYGCVCFISSAVAKLQNLSSEFFSVCFLLAAMPLTKKQQEEMVKHFSEGGNGGKCCICLEAVNDDDHLYVYGCCNSAHHLGCVLEWAVAEGEPVERLLCPSCDKEPEARRNKNYSGPQLPRTESSKAKSKEEKKAAKDKAFKQLEETLLSIQNEVRRRSQGTQAAASTAAVEQKPPTEAQTVTVKPDAHVKNASTDAVEQPPLQGAQAPTGTAGPSQETIPGTIVETETQDF